MDKSLRYIVSATDKNAGKTIGDVEAKGVKATKSIGAAFGQLGSVVGGEVGELATKTSEAFDQIGESGGKSLSEKLAIGGTAIAGIGVALSAMGAQETEATNQLQTAVQNAGGDWEEFEGKVSGVESAMEKYGHTAVDTQGALTKLTNATHDPDEALKQMQLTADLAASSNISLSSAADQVGKALNGSGRIFKQYGIEVQKSADGTYNYKGAVSQLAAELSGQADAKANSFTGTLRHLRAEVEDNVAAFGQKYGPALTTVGVSMIAFGPIAKGAAGAVKGIGSSFRASATEAEASAAAITTADGEIAAANEAAAASSTAAGEGAGVARTGMLGAAGAAGPLAVAMAAVAVGGFAISKALGDGKAYNAMISGLKGADDAVGQLTDQFVNSKDSTEAISEAWAKSAVQADGLAQKAAAAGISEQQLTSAILDGPQAVDALTEAWKRQGKPSGLTLATLQRLSEGYQSARDKADALRGSSDQVSSEFTVEAGAGAKLSDVITELSGDFDKLNSKTLDAEKADIAVKDAIAAITKKTIDHSHALTDNTAKGRNNISMILDAIGAAQQHAQAVLKQSGSSDKATEAFQRDRQALQDHLVALGFDAGAVQHLIDKYAKMPKLKETKLDLQDRASAKLSALEAKLQRLTGEPWTVTVNADGSLLYTTKGSMGAPIRFTASGTDYAAGGRTMVAERETEIIDLPRGSKVTPLSKYARPHTSTLDIGPLVDELRATGARIVRAIQAADHGPVHIGDQAFDRTIGRRADRFGRGN